LAFWSFSYTPRTEVRKRPSVTLSTLDLWQIVTVGSYDGWFTLRSSLRAIATSNAFLPMRVEAFSVIWRMARAI
jgi:hypothetical protein